MKEWTEPRVRRIDTWWAKQSLEINSHLHGQFPQRFYEEMIAHVTYA